MPASAPRVLAVAHGPEPADDADRLLVAALDACARAGARTVLVAPDHASARMLAALGVAPTPAPAGAEVLALPAAHAAIPLVAAWPSYADPSLAAARADRASADDAALRSWRARTLAAVRTAHLADPVGLVLAVPTAASAASAQLLANELAVPVAAVVAPGQAVDPVLAEAARTVLVVDGGLDAAAARLLAELTS